MSHNDLKGQVAIVTGASRGIGKAIALAFAQEGVSLILAARSADDLRQAQAEIETLGGQAWVAPGDVSREEDARAIVRVAADAGRLDILVNCAGVGVFGPLASTSVADWDRAMAVNVRGPFLMCREALPLMAQNKAGCIINIASVVGVKGYSNQGAYTASKHALMGLTKVLAQEAQPLGVRVHVVCPGGVDTEMAAQARPDLDRSILIRPEEIADLVLLLVKQRGLAIVDQINVRRSSSAPWFD